MRTPRFLAALYGLLFVSLAVLDQSTKFHAQKAFLVSSNPERVQEWVADSHRVLRWGQESWIQLDFTYVRNTGAIWGILQNLPRGLSNAFFLAVYPLFMILLGHTFWKSHPGQRILRTAIVLILSGAVGNFIDRLTLGYVVDWVHVQWRLLGWEYSYPVFNVADMAIVSGVVLWLIDGLGEAAASRNSRS